MAYINGEFEFKDTEITISVLEPTEGENGYGKGMKICLDCDWVDNLSLEDFKEAVEWMKERIGFIENNFTKEGKSIV